MLPIFKIISLLICITFSIANAEIPNCHYSDTVDLTRSRKFPDGSYEYQNLTIPANMTGEYEYKIHPNGSVIEKPKHIRGCVCKLKPCIQFCCPHNQRLIGGTCFNHTDSYEKYDPFLNVTFNNGTETRVHLLQMFVVQQLVPMECKQHGHFSLDNREKHLQWNLFENGSMRRNHDSVYLKKSDYCMQTFDMGQGPYQIVPHNCRTPEPKPWFKTIVLVLSLICLLLTIGVYLYVPKLRNLHGKCFICYMIAIFTAYFVLVLEYWHLLEKFCLPAGYLGYYAVMAAFFWLTAMSLELWSCFQGTSFNIQRYKPKKRFLTYSLYAWGMALVLTMLIIILDSNIPLEKENLLWIPGVGVIEGSCWIKTHDWSAMLYFYGPMLILIIFNITLFILTAKRVIAIKKDMQLTMNRQESQNYGFFLRLSVIMGVSWIFEIFSYLVPQDNALQHVFRILDYFHMGQGILIFVLFVLKRDVLKLVSDRIQGKKSEDEVKSEEEFSLQERKLGPSILS